MKKVQPKKKKTSQAKWRRHIDLTWNDHVDHSVKADLIETIRSFFDIIKLFLDKVRDYLIGKVNALEA